jgi:VanZ family protein
VCFLNQKKFWKIFFSIYTIALVISTIIKPPFNFSSYYYEDKIIHLLSFFIASDLFSLAFYDNKKKFKYYFFLLIFSLLPIGIEYIQTFSIYRTFSYDDMLFGYYGIILGLMYFFVKRKAFKN